MTDAKAKAYREQSERALVMMREAAAKAAERELRTLPKTAKGVAAVIRALPLGEEK